MKLVSCLLLVTVSIVNLASAQDTEYKKAKVSFRDFQELVVEVEKHREARLIDLDTFLKMSREPNVIVLDTRSDFRYERIHIKGAKHLAFTDFTQGNLENVIPSPETKILIYCNNNFEGDEVDFASKAFDPKRAASTAKMSQIAQQEKPRTLALNIPSYINLFGYGYREVYELDELVNVDDPRIEFEGTIVKKSASKAR
ncbi:MAG: rhodanese-like domain-containing protein [Planctomycetaceae bacterium]|nr:rhodanese-like domain-containing protein [Planctomycetaceae bacterium]